MLYNCLYVILVMFDSQGLYNMKENFDYPFLGYGLGLRIPHQSHILENKPNIDWFEVISENYMNAGGKPKRVLEDIREHYPIILHGVGLSVGSPEPVDQRYLQQLKELVEWVNPPWLSDHLCWTGVGGKNSHDLLPVPYTDEMLSHIVDKIKHVQDYLGRRILIENPSSYLEFSGSYIPESEFLAALSEKSDCALLLDVNNVYVSCYNHHLDVKEYMDNLPLDRVVQVHLSGHHNYGSHIVDTHDNYVVDEVWNIYRYLIAKAGREINTMVEWDNNIPEFSVLEGELNKAKEVAKNAYLANDLVQLYQENSIPNVNQDTFPQVMDNIIEGITNADHNIDLSALLREKSNLSYSEQIGVYQHNYTHGLLGAVSEDYKYLRIFLGEEQMEALLEKFIADVYSENFNIYEYSYMLPEYIKQSGFVEGKTEIAYNLALAEAAMRKMFHAPDSIALSLEDLSQIKPEELFDTKLYLVDAACVLKFDYAMNEILAQYESGELPNDFEPTETYLLVYRENEEIWRVKMQYEEYCLLSQFSQGKSIAQAIDNVSRYLEISEEQSLGYFQQYFSKWLQIGVLKIEP